MSALDPLRHVEAWLKEYYALANHARDARAELWARLGRWFRDEQRQRIEAIVCFESAVILAPDHAEAKTAASELRARPPRAMTAEEHAVVQASANHVPELPSQWDPGPPPRAKEYELRAELERLMSAVPVDPVLEGEKLWALSMEVKSFGDLATEALALRGHAGTKKYLEATRKKYATIDADRARDAKEHREDATWRRFHEERTRLLEGKRFAEAELLYLREQAGVAALAGTKRMSVWVFLMELYVDHWPLHRAEAQMAHAVVQKLAPASMAPSTTLERLKEGPPALEPGEIDPRTDRLAFDHAVAKLAEERASTKLERMLLRALERGGPPDLEARLRRGLAHHYFDIGERQRARLFFEALALTDELHAPEQSKLAVLRAPATEAVKAPSRWLSIAEQHRRDPARRIEALLAYEAAVREEPSSTQAKEALDAMRATPPAPAELAAFDPFVDWYAYDHRRIELRARALVAKGERERGRALFELLRAAGTAVEETAPPEPPVAQHRFPWERMTDEQKKHERELLVAYVRAWKAGHADVGKTFTTLGRLWRDGGDRMRAILAFATVDDAESRRALAELLEWPAPSVVPGEIGPTKDWPAFEETLKRLDRPALRRAFELVVREERTPSAITSPNGRAGAITYVLARDHWMKGDTVVAASFYEMMATGGVDLELSRDIDSLRRELGL